MVTKAIWWVVFLNLINGLFNTEAKDIPVECGIDNRNYSVIHLPSNTYFRIDVDLATIDTSYLLHLFFTLDFTKETVFDIQIRRLDSMVYEFKCSDNGQFNTTTNVTAENVTISYMDNEVIKVQNMNGSIIREFQLTNTLKYFWYDVGIPISGCKIEFGSECTVEVGNETQNLEANCVLNRCIWQWERDQRIFENCTDCAHILADCGHYRSLYMGLMQNLNHHTPPTNDMIENPITVPITSDVFSSPQHNPVGESGNPTQTDLIKFETTAVLDESVTEKRSTTEIRRLDQTTSSDSYTTETNGEHLTAPSRDEVITTDTVYRETANPVIQYTVEENTQGMMTETNISSSGITDTLAIATTTEEFKPSHSWTTGLLIMTTLTAAVVVAFLVGCICAIHGLLLKPRKRRKVTPEKQLAQK